ncbi:MAG: 2,3-bisphosphoglycerate-independent phosphoglycerate mutase, partial [Candidatus Limnocylindria bacterium]
MTVLLVVLDGFGLNDDPSRNALLAASMGNWHRLVDKSPHCRLEASGQAVGLPAGQMGNSEVGHLNLGAGFRVLQDLPRVTAAIDDGSFFENETLIGVAGEVAARGGRLHLVGLVGPGGIHAVDEHIVAMVDLAHRSGLPADRVLFHAFTDGRDTPPRSAATLLPALEGSFAGRARIATVSGRYYGMDRDKRWDRTKRAYDAIVHGEGRQAASATDAVAAAYARGEGDEFIQPT